MIQAAYANIINKKYRTWQLSVYMWLPFVLEYYDLIIDPLPCVMNWHLMTKLIVKSHFKIRPS